MNTNIVKGLRVLHETIRRGATCPPGFAGFQQSTVVSVIQRKQRNQEQRNLAQSGAAKPLQFRLIVHLIAGVNDFLLNWRRHPPLHADDNDT